jgi:hypothetical protein
MPKCWDRKLALLKPTNEDVAAFLVLTKSLVREMEWIGSPSKKATGWAKFQSFCYLGTTLSDEVDFRAQYRARAIDRRGGSSIEIPEAFYMSIWIRNHRVYGIDTKPGQCHTNAIVQGMPHSGAIIKSLTHEHVWTVAADDYVEPIEPPILELETAIEKFCDRVNLLLNGPFVHPMKGKTEQLI